MPSVVVKTPTTLPPSVTTTLPSFRLAISFAADSSEVPGPTV
jgi:hypothetical protein